MSEVRDPRSFLATCLVQYGYSHDTAETVVQGALDTHVHEQAEILRAFAQGVRLGGEDAGADWIERAAHFIDTEDRQ